MTNVAAVVKRAVGFAPAFEYVAEATVATGKGKVTARAGAHTAAGAVARAKMAVREREMFAGFKRGCGFNADGVVRDTHVNTGFRVGFAGGAA